MILTLLLAFATLVVVFLGLYQFWLDIGERSLIHRAMNPEAVKEETIRRRSRIDRLITRSRWGDSVRDAIALTGVSLSPTQFVLGSAVFCLVLGLLLGSQLSWLLFPVGVYAGVLIIRAYLRRKRDQRKEEFIAQMPELARTLSNASSAGLSIRTAIAMAADDLDEPARDELRTVSDEINLGIALDTAMSNLERRLPSRELAILVSTLVVSSRSGGAIVSSLRDIAGTLETRKEVRREIRTTYAQIVATSYAVLGVGAASLVFLELLNSGTVDAMLRNPIGQAALVFAALVYTGCIVIVRRATRIEF